MCFLKDATESLWPAYSLKGSLVSGNETPWTSLSGV